MRFDGWMSAGWLVFCWISPLDFTWSGARCLDGGPAPVHDDDSHIWGLHGLSGEDAERVRQNNALTSFAAHAMRRCHELNIPVVRAQSVPSRFWLCPPVLQVLALPSVRVFSSDLCALGSCWKRPVQFAAVMVDLGSAMQSCGSHTVCRFSGKRHAPLPGWRGNVRLAQLA